MLVTSLCGNSDLNLDTSLDVDDDLLDDLGGGVQVDETLVNSIETSVSILAALSFRDITLFNSPHLVHVPSLGTLTARSLAGGDLQVLGGKADRALDTQLLGLGTLNELAADLLEGGDLARGEGDADLVDLGGIALGSLLGVLERHFRWFRGGLEGYAITTVGLSVFS